ncbi:hypothetical protein LguiA_013378 [Lonicera macranthoides]
MNNQMENEEKLVAKKKRGRPKKEIQQQQQQQITCTVRQRKRKIKEEFVEGEEESQARLRLSREERYATRPVKKNNDSNNKKKNEIDSNTCHQCKRNDKGRVVRCLKCSRKRFCVPCMTRWYYYKHTSLLLLLRFIKSKLP